MAHESSSSNTARPAGELASNSSLGASFTWLGLIIAVAVVYFVFARLGLRLAFHAEQVSPVWPASGIALAAIVTGGYRFALGVAIGAFAANYVVEQSIWMASGIALGNTLEAVAGAWLLSTIGGFDARLDRIRDVLGLILLAAVVSTAISATIGVTCLTLGGGELPSMQRPIEWGDFVTLWRVWWIGDAMGVLVVAPPLLTTIANPLWARSQLAELFALLAALVATCSLLFVSDSFTQFGQASLAYPVFPYVIWSALRLDQRATSYVVLIASALMLGATVGDRGPFGIGLPHEGLVLLEVFVGVVAISALMLGAALSERRSVQRQVVVSGETSRIAVEELQALVDISPVGIFIAQDPACDFITANPAGAAMLQIPDDANSSKTGADGDKLPFVVTRDGVPVADVDLPMQRAVRTGEPVSGDELEVTRGDGSQVTLLEYATPLFDAQGNVRGCLGVFVDITDRKRAEQTLKELDRRKDEFLATLAHELRNPLSPIRTGVDLLKVMDRDDPEFADVLATMDRQIFHLTRLVDDLLDVSRVTRGKVHLQRERTDLATAIQAAVEANKPLINEQAHELTVSLPAEPLYVNGDPTRLAQVFGNLVNNAVKYTDRGGKITITADREEQSAVVRVKDTGQGIEPEMLPHVFELFTQVDRSINSAHGGLGIGLTLVQELVELHGGSVKARSGGAGQGSEFIVRLPLVAVGGRGTGTRPDTAQTPSAPSACRILVVDDNVDAARTLSLILSKRGHQVSVANSGQQALELLSADRPDVVLLDIGMPDMDGYEVAGQIRRKTEFNDVRLIALTGWGQSEDRQRALSVGFDYHLTKPVDFLSLSKVLAEAATGMGPKAI